MGFRSNFVSYRTCIIKQIDLCKIYLLINLCLQTELLQSPEIPRIHFWFNSYLNVSTSVLSAMSAPVGCAQFIEKVIDEFQVQNLITTHDLQINFYYKWFTYKIDLDTQYSKGHKNTNKSSNFFWRYQVIANTSWESVNFQWPSQKIYEL